MEITVQYTGQLAGLAGVSEESVELTEGAVLSQLVDALVARHGAEYSDLLLTKEGKVRPSLLVIFDGEQADGPAESLELGGVKTVMLMTPIAGG